MNKQVRDAKILRRIAWAFIAFGTLFVGIGGAVAVDSASYLSSGERASGTVVDLEWRSSHSHYSGSSRNRQSSGPSAYPVIAFTAKDGEKHTFRDNSGSNPPAYEVGERVEVLYRADSPEDARINGFLSLWLIPVIFGGLGSVFAAVGTVIVVVMRKKARAALGSTRAGSATAGSAKLASTAPGSAA
ncbi:DUF3592 domain-containing protein [Streptomyces sp. NPDC047024]|uniref:DUF3592 domain-containing protein n=1 Tax=Streptomyces sp. NPDC047024 TaxID=3155476 RepID=UPI003408B085